MTMFDSTEIFLQQKESKQQQKKAELEAQKVEFEQRRLTYEKFINNRKGKRWKVLKTIIHAC